MPPPPAAVVPARRLARQQSRPDFVEGKKEVWRPSGLQWRVAAYITIAVVAIVVVVLLAVAGLGGGDKSAGGSGWTVAVTLSNTSSGTSPSFALSGIGQRLKFDVSSSSPGAAADYRVCVVPKNIALDKAAEYAVLAGSIEALPNGGSKNQVIEFTQAQGDYYLAVISGNCTWSATIWDNR